MTAHELHRKRARKAADRKVVRLGKRQAKEAKRVLRLKNHGQSETVESVKVKEVKPIYADPPKASWVTKIKGIVNRAFRGR